MRFFVSALSALLLLCYTVAPTDAQKASSSDAIAEADKDLKDNVRRLRTYRRNKAKFGSKVKSIIMDSNYRNPNEIITGTGPKGLLGAAYEIKSRPVSYRAFSDGMYDKMEKIPTLIGTDGKPLLVKISDYQEMNIQAINLLKLVADDSQATYFKVRDNVLQVVIPLTKEKLNELQKTQYEIYPPPTERAVEVQTYSGSERFTAIDNNPVGSTDMLGQIVLEAARRLQANENAIDRALAMQIGNRRASMSEGELARRQYIRGAMARKQDAIDSARNEAELDDAEEESEEIDLDEAAVASSEEFLRSPSTYFSQRRARVQVSVTL